MDAGRAKRLIGVVQLLSARRPDLLPRFFKARRKVELRVIHRLMGIGWEVNGRRRTREALKMPIKGHAALLWEAWPNKYADPPPPPPATVRGDFSNLVALRQLRFLKAFHLYSPDDSLELDRITPRALWNFMTASDKSIKEPKKVHIPDELASLIDQ